MITLQIFMNWNNTRQINIFANRNNIHDILANRNRNIFSWPKYQGIDS